MSCSASIILSPLYYIAGLQRQHNIFYAHIVLCLIQSFHTSHFSWF